MHIRHHRFDSVIAQYIHQIINIMVMCVKSRFVNLCFFYNIGNRYLFNRFLGCQGKKSICNCFFCLFYTNIHNRSAPFLYRLAGTLFYLQIINTQRIQDKKLANQPFLRDLLIARFCSCLYNNNCRLEMQLVVGKMDKRYKKEKT